MTLTNYKGILTAIALTGAAALVWYDRTDSTHVHAVDAAELGAGAVDRASELSGDTSTVWVSTGWQVDASVTNQWGGYESFQISNDHFCGGAGNGTYFFSSRTYGRLSYYGNEYIGGAFDIYTNTVGNYPMALIDCGPAGAEVTAVPYAWIPRSKTHSWFWRYPVTPGYLQALECQPWTNIESGVMYSSTFTTEGGGQQYDTPRYFTFSNPTYPTSGVSRLRYYSPHVLTYYINTILGAFDMAVIVGIRSAILGCVNDGAPPCFIGPTNEGATYDGLTSFPLVSTSAWASIYRTWATDGYSVTNISTNVAFDALFVTHTNGTTETIIGISDGYGSFSSADGQWSWSTPYGYAQYVPAIPDGEIVYWLKYGKNPWALAPYDIDSILLTGHGTMTAAITTTVSTATNIVWNPNESIYIKTNELAWHYSAMQRLRDSLIPTTARTNPPTTFTVTNLWTGVEKSIEWYARSNAPAGWLLFDSSASVGVGATSAQLGDRGWPTTNVSAVLRWHQRSCTNTVFDLRYQ